MGRYRLLLAIFVFACADTHPLPVQFSITEYSGVSRTAMPATFGLPVEQGQIPGAALEQPAPVHVSGMNGQFTTLALWPDGSAKWVLCDIQPTLASRASQNFDLVAGTQIPATSLTVADSATKITVATGAITFEVLKGNSFNGLNKVWNGSTLMVNADNTSGLIVTQGATEYFGRANADSCYIEEQGPLRVCIRVVGFFYSSTNEQLVTDSGYVAWGKRPLRFIMRIHAYAGKDFITVHSTLHNPGFYGVHESLTFKGFFLRLGYTHGASAAVLGPESYSTTLGATDSLEFLLAHLNATNPYCDDGTPPPSTEKNSNIHYWYTRNGVDVKNGNACEGWLDINNGTTGLMVSRRNFWQMHPAGFAALANALEVRYLPIDVKGNVKYDKYTLWVKAADYWLPGSRQRTWVTDLKFYSGAQSTQAALDFNLATQRPLIGLASPVYYHSAAGLGPFPLADYAVAGQPRLDTAIFRQKRMHQVFVDTNAAIQDENAWGHKMDLDMMRNFNFHTHALGWVNYGDWKWSDAFNNLHYDLSGAMLYGFLRTGNGKMFYEGADETVFLRDLGTCNYWSTTPLTNTWPNSYDGTDPVWKIWYQAGVSYYEKWLHFIVDDGYQMPKTSHNWNEGIALHYLLTGDRLTRDVFRFRADASDRNLHGPSTLATNESQTFFNDEIRSITWPLLSLATAYDVFGDARYLTTARKAFNQSLYNCLKTNPGRYTRPADWSNPVGSDWQVTTNMLRIGVLGVMRLYTTMKRVNPADPDLPKIVEFMDSVSTILLRDRIFGGYWEMQGADSIRCPYGMVYTRPNTVQSLNDNTPYLFSFAGLEAFLYMAHGKTEPDRLARARDYFTDAMFYYDASYPRPDSVPIVYPTTMARVSTQNPRIVGFTAHGTYHSGYVSHNEFIDGKRIITPRSSYFAGTACKYWSDCTNHAAYYLDYEADISQGPTSIDNPPLDRIHQFGISVFPNPFNPSIAIRIIRPNAGANPEAPVQLTVYDISGRRVADLSKQIHGNKAVWTAGNQASGIYFLQAKAGNQVIKRRITLIK
ncbi:MAG: T9SS type A sorting domain-containing protein [Fibrobacterota bacterium]